MPTATKLNLGAGDTRIPGYTPIDRKLGTEAYPLDYPDESIEIIRASHVLEHFSFADAMAAIADWVRVLRPDGRLRLAVPDFDQIVARRHADDRWPFYLMGGQTNADDFHRSVWSADRLIAAMTAVGLVDLKSWSDNVVDCSSLPISLNIEGRKPTETTPEAEPPDQAEAEPSQLETPETESPQEAPKPSEDMSPPTIATFRQQIKVEAKVVAVTSIPRVGWSDHYGCLEAALRPHNIPLRPFHGVYWGPCMSNVMEDCLTDGVDWLLVLDYDTVFTVQHVRDVLQTFAQYPHIDALASNEVRRNQDAPLVTIKGVTAVDYTGEPIRVSTAHFGLTLIRMSALAEVPKPWFRSEPGPDGSWRHEEAFHEDIWFWHQWRLAGKTIHLAPDVRVGQLELTVVFFDEDMRVCRMRINDWMQLHYGRTSRHEHTPHQTLPIPSGGRSD